MQYKFAKEQLDYADFSSGRVFYSQPGYPAFPVRLASEIFQRCMAQCKSIYQVSEPCVLYDPCCGSGYQLGVLGYLHGEHIQEMIGSDIDERAVQIAQRNLGLLHPEGLNKRIHELSEMLKEFGKDSHREALASAALLNEKLSARTKTSQLVTHAFQANALNPEEISKYLRPGAVDIVITDVPYGLQSNWTGANSNALTNPLETMLDALLDFLSPASVVAISSDKAQKAFHKSYRRLEQFQIGKRRVAILRPLPS